MTLSAPLAQAADPRVSTNHTWQFTEDPEYSYTKGTASQLISIKEAVLHHTLSIKLNRSLIDSFTFKVGCMLQNPTPLLELRVNSLDIRLFDSVNDFVFARFEVDNGQEYSLRGDLAGRNRILFAPITKNQERSLADLFLQMREGGTLKIGLLQGDTGKVRFYNVPLAGFMEHSDKLLQSCQNYNKAYRGERSYLPDYMAKEPDGYAPRDFSLKEDDEEVIDPFAPKPVVVEEKIEVENKAEPTPEVLPFVPGGGPASIGSDGKPIGAQNGASATGKVGDTVERSLGNAQGPMQIGPDGKPIAPAYDKTVPEKVQVDSSNAPQNDKADKGMLDIF